MRGIILSLSLVALCLLGVAYAFTIRQPLLVQSAADDSCTPSDIIGGPFALIDHTGAAVTEQTYRGKYMLVEFGFTACPDICPMQLATATAALDKLSAKAGRITPLFVTLDPERDTPAILQSYLKSFPRFTGLTGSAGATDQIAKAYKVYYAKVPNAKSPADYTIDHTVRMFLMDPNGRFLQMYDRDTPAELATKLDRCIS